MSPSILRRVKRETWEECAARTDWIPPRLVRPAQPYEYEDDDDFCAQ
jgi:hypothetical protein